MDDGADDAELEIQVAPPLPPLPGNLEFLSSDTLWAVAKARPRTDVVGHEDNGHHAIGPGERHGPRLISGCASVWALAGGHPVYAHCSSGIGNFGALVNAVRDAQQSPGSVTAIRIARPSRSGTEVLSDLDGADGRQDIDGARAQFPNAVISRWFIGYGVTTYFDQDGYPTPY